MAELLEVLQQGLMNARDPVLMPEGALQKAVNAKYRTADPALWQAEGRALMGSGDQGSGEAIQGMVGIRWESFSGAATGEVGTELFQLIFIPRPLVFVESLVPKASPEDVSHDDVRQYNFPGLGKLWTPGTEPLELIVMTNNDAAPVEQNAIVLTGGQSFAMRRTPQQIVAHGTVGTPVITSGLALNGGLAPFACHDEMDPQFVGTLGDDVEDGLVYTHWVVWRSAADTQAEGSNPGGEITSSSWYSKPTHILQSDYDPGDRRSIILEIDLGPADDRPSQMNQIRVYRCKEPASPIKIGDDDVLPNQWPNGITLDTITIADIPDACTVGTNWYWKDSDQEILYYKDQGSLYSDKGDPFPTTSVVLAGLQIQASANGPPPNSSTGDVFQGSLVVDDKDVPRRIRWSMPGSPHAFPFIFFLDVETGNGDEIRSLKAIGNVLLAIFENEVRRINWLPTQTDPDFRQGDVVSEVGTGFGALSKTAVTKFRMPGQGPMVAMAHPSGLWATNGWDRIELSRNIAWEDMTSELQGASLIDNYDAQRLELYYQAPNETDVNYALYFQYDIAHLDRNGTPTVTGPIERPGGVKAAAVISIAGGATRVVTADRAGNLLYEGFGFQDASLGVFTPLDAMTREIYPMGMGKEVIMEKARAHLKASQFGGGVFLVDWELGPDVAQESQVVTEGARQLILPQIAKRAEYLTMRIRGQALEEAGISVSVNAVGASYRRLREADRA